jgi:hypothetical protein
VTAAGIDYCNARRAVALTPSAMERAKPERRLRALR